MSTQLAVFENGEGDLPEPTRRLPHPDGAAALTRRQKAAIVVRLLIAEGATLPLQDMPEALQAELTSQMASMRFVDRATLREVIEEFATELDSIGLSFPDGIEGALALLNGAISPDMAARLRWQSGAVWTEDPWRQIAEISNDRLLKAVDRESPEIGAVILSKLTVAKAADILGRLPGPKARRLTLAISETAAISPEVVRRIGVALAAHLKAEPPRAFTATAVDRLGAILNISPAITREEVLSGLDEEDADLANEVRRAIFTFENIPERVDERDVPAIIRQIAQDTLAVAIAGATGRAQPAAEFILSRLPQRLADSIREAVEDRGKVTPAEAEQAQNEIVAAIRAAADAGEITMIVPDDRAGAAA